MGTAVPLAGCEADPSDRQKSQGALVPAKLALRGDTVTSWHVGKGGKREARRPRTRKTNEERGKVDRLISGPVGQSEQNDLNNEPRTPKQLGQHVVLSLPQDNDPTNQERRTKN